MKYSVTEIDIMALCKAHHSIRSIDRIRYLVRCIDSIAANYWKILANLHGYQRNVIMNFLCSSEFIQCIEDSRFKVRQRGSGICIKGLFEAGQSKTFTLVIGGVDNTVSIGKESVSRSHGNGDLAVKCIQINSKRYI